ncbi:MAG: hypothetical protein RLZZ232_2941 [Planctomycetota bacterium]|jgi:hypothetical protein
MCECYKQLVSNGIALRVHEMVSPVVVVTGHRHTWKLPDRSLRATGMNRGEPIF